MNPVLIISQVHAYVAGAKSQLKIQGEHGNWNCNAYMLGMYNGMECALATIEGRMPQFRRKPVDGFLDDRSYNKKEAESSLASEVNKQ